jgi:hypothetical protein
MVSAKSEQDVIALAMFADFADETSPSDGLSSAQRVNP